MYDSKVHGKRLPQVGGGDRGDLRLVRTALWTKKVVSVRRPHPMPISYVVEGMVIFAFKVPGRRCRKKEGHGQQKQDPARQRSQGGEACEPCRPARAHAPAASNRIRRPYCACYQGGKVCMCVCLCVAGLAYGAWHQYKISSLTWLTQAVASGAAVVAASVAQASGRARSQSESWPTALRLHA